MRNRNVRSVRMKRATPNALRTLLFSEDEWIDLTGRAQGLHSSDQERVGAALNAAFLVALFSDSAQRGTALAAVSALRTNRRWARCARYYLTAYRRTKKTLDAMCKRIASSQPIATESGEQDEESEEERQHRLFQLFFPEGAPLLKRADIPACVTELRKKREIKIDALNDAPIKNPAREILFTSNVMLTTPLGDAASMPFSSDFNDRLEAVRAEEQNYWFDHPIPIGIRDEENEILYGLRGLNEMMAVEKKRGVVDEGERLHCLLSASATHTGLQSLIHEYFDRYLGDVGNFKHLALTVMTEKDCTEIVERCLLPAARRCGCSKKERDALRAVFGVDGEYGRHYSFLKAISALWHVCVDSRVRATFKIDLDQVFPQSELIDQTGASALEHFKTPLWGATGRDYWGRKVELGMIAGALVNEADIGRGVFTPDVVMDYASLERRQPLGTRIFNSKIPQAFSTEVEMGNRGSGSVAQRIHVTGGTNGILVRALRRHRPFTPLECGRAEDQAYLMSVLQRTPPYLRYLHKSGLIMRHDKAAFAGQSIKKARVGTQTGDYIRTLFFSAYARCHPWSPAEIKRQFDPFTGAFISHMPMTVAYVRCALDVHTHFQNGHHQIAEQLMQNAALRLPASIRRFSAPRLQRQIARERRGWECYYNLLDAIERGVAEGSEYYMTLRTRARKIIDACRIAAASE